MRDVFRLTFLINSLIILEATFKFKYSINIMIIRVRVSR